MYQVPTPGDARLKKLKKGVRNLDIQGAIVCCFPPRSASSVPTARSCTYFVFCGLGDDDDDDDDDGDDCDDD